MFEPGLIHVKELWTDQIALDLHIASDHIVEWRTARSSLGIGDRNLCAYDVDESRQT